MPRKKMAARHTQKRILSAHSQNIKLRRLFDRTVIEFALSLAEFDSHKWYEKCNCSSMAAYCRQFFPRDGASTLRYYIQIGYYMAAVGDAVTIDEWAQLGPTVIRRLVELKATGDQIRQLISISGSDPISPHDVEGIINSFS